MSNLPPSSPLTLEEQRKASKHPKSHRNKSIFFPWTWRKKPSFLPRDAFILGFRSDAWLQARLCPRFSTVLCLWSATQVVHRKSRVAFAGLSRNMCLDGLWQRSFVLYLLLEGYKTLLSLPCFYPDAFKQTSCVPVRTGGSAVSCPRSVTALWNISKEKRFKKSLGNNYERKNTKWGDRPFGLKKN